MTEPLPGLHSAGISVRAYGSWLCASLSGFLLDLSPECSLPGLPPLSLFGLSSSLPRTLMVSWLDCWIINTQCCILKCGHKGRQREERILALTATGVCVGGFFHWPLVAKAYISQDQWIVTLTFVENSNAHKSLPFLFGFPLLHCHNSFAYKFQVNLILIYTQVLG